MTKEKSDFLVSLETSLIFLLKKEANGDTDLLVEMYKNFLDDITNPEVVGNIVHFLIEVDEKFMQETDWVKSNGSAK